MSVPARPSLRGAWLAAAAGLAAVLLWEAAGWDLAAARVYGQSSGFALRDAWLTRDLLHDGGRWLAAALLLLLGWDAWRPLLAGPSRHARAFWLAVIVASMLLVPLPKRLSLTSCPWELAEFGGVAAYVPHWLPGVADGGPGHCFPSGHAVAAFGFFGLYFLWRGERPRLARAALAATLLFGIVFGWAQLARGAHFVSHTLWSAWLCWTLACAAAALQARFGNTRATRSAAAGWSRPGESLR